jgi:hypothetical protein
MEGGFDLVDASIFQPEQERTPFADLRAELFLDASGRSRIGTAFRLESGRTHAELLLTVLTSLDRLRPRLTTGVISPEAAGVHGRVFLDEDADGRMDPGERGLVGIKVQLGGRQSTETRAGGYFAFSGGSTTTARATQVAVELGSVPADLTPVHVRQDVELQPGRLTPLNLGLTPLLAVTGRVLVVGTEPKPLVGVAVRLVAVWSDEVRAESLTDGERRAFYLGELTPGEYVLVPDVATLPAGHSADSVFIRLEPGREARQIDVGAVMVHP